ncbi:MAG: hypothetical protein ACYDED_07230 [Ferrimicrobium sp.]
MTLIRRPSETGPPGGGIGEIGSVIRRFYRSWSSRRRTNSPRTEAKRSRCRSFRSALGRERLETVGDNLDGPLSAAVGGLPLAALKSFDVDEASLAEVAASEAGELAGAGLSKLWGGDEAPDEGTVICKVGVGFQVDQG